jgi:hypothetical protein
VTTLYFESGQPEPDGALAHRAELIRARDAIILRNQITKAFAVPCVAELFFGATLRDDISLPQYPD